MWLSLVLLLVGLHIALGPRIRLSEWNVTRAGNTAFDEALQWRKGTMALSNANPRWEAPMIDGQCYNAVGPAFVLISLFGTAVSGWLGAEPETFFGPIFVLLIAIPLPLAAFAVFRSLTRSSIWGAVLSAYLIAGTPVAPVLAICRNGSIYHIDHVLAVTGLLIMAGDLLGKRRIWPAVLGLMLAVWSRQMTCFYALPILWVAFRLPPTNERTTAAPTTVPSGRRRLLLAVVGIAIVAAYPMTLSYIKFGNPLETGYGGMYHTRDDQVARDGRACLWGPRWFERHLRAMNLTVPTVDVRNNTIHLVHDGKDGASIWLTSPILLGIWITITRWWRDPARRALMLATLPVVIGVCGYHTTEAWELGFYRYALDFIPIWLAVIAPYVSGPRAAPWTLGCFAASALYYHYLIT